jgi:hypothetical protein
MVGREDERAPVVKVDTHAQASGEKLRVSNKEIHRRSGRFEIRQAVTEGSADRGTECAIRKSCILADAAEVFVMKRQLQSVVHPPRTLRRGK